MYKLNLDSKYFYVIPHDSINISLFIEEKFKKYYQDVFYEVYYIGAVDAAGHYCPYIPLTFTGLYMNKKDTKLPENINKGCECKIDKIFYVDVNNEVKSTHTYNVNICTYDKKTYSKLRLML